MKPSPSDGLTRRDFVRATSAMAAAAVAGRVGGKAGEESSAATPAQKLASKGSKAYLEDRSLFTPAKEFRDVSRGNPKPFAITGDALARARLTPQDWRLEIITDPAIPAGIAEVPGTANSFTLADGTAMNLASLLNLGRTVGVRFLKAMQCLNIPQPLGQGLWEGVPLRDVLRLCGPMRNVRRVFYSGFHNNDPAQLFQSSLSYTQAMETPPGGLPAFLAYRLNGEPIPLIRGGPVRMVIPWAHGFKSIKWLQRIVLTNDYKINDTYAEQNNDPESHLKTAAYFNELTAKHPVGQPVRLNGLVISGFSGLKRVEFSLAPDSSRADSATERDGSRWTEAELEEPPLDWTNVLPGKISPRSVLGFDPRTGHPQSWPLPYSMISWHAVIENLPPGKYSVRARAVDLNGFAQPEPRPNQKSGRNAVETKEFEVA